MWSWTMRDEVRARLRNAVAEFRTLFGHGGEIDPRFVRMVEQSARLKDLKFDMFWIFNVFLYEN